MTLADTWRRWRKARALKRLQRRHHQPPERLHPGHWIAGGEAAPDPERELLAAKAEKLSAAFKAARRARPAGRGRRTRRGR